MKNRSFISILAILFAATFMASSCDDMLTPELKRYTEDYAQDSVYSAFGILKGIQKVGERSVLLDAARSDLSTVPIRPIPSRALPTSKILRMVLAPC